MLGSFTDLATSASAAKCITASILCCTKPFSSCSRFPRSTLQNPAPGGPAARWPSTRLSSAITFIPRESKTSAQMLPIYPAAPVTRIFKGCSWLTQKKRLKLNGLEYITTASGSFATREQKATGLDLRQAALERQQNQVRAAPDAEFIEQIRNVKLHRTFRDIQLAGDFLVRKVLEQRIQHFLLTPAQVGH